MNEILTRSANSGAFDHAPARLTIDTGALVNNWRQMARLSGDAETSAVVKADAYGLGASAVAKALAAAGCRTFFIATPDEGVRLRSALPDARIFVLTGIWPGVEADILGNRLIPVICSPEQLVFFRTCGGDHPYALYVDTGMNRLGFSMDEAAALAETTSLMPSMVMSHLACADMHGHPMNRKQLESFQAVSRMFAGIESSLANSGGIFLGPDFQFDMTRPGIALYGGDATDCQPFSSKPVVTAEARILQIRNVRAGEAVSYGATHVFSRDSRIAVVGAGYADGWQRSMSGSGVPLRDGGLPGASVFVDGQHAPIVGRITMDLSIFDLGQIPESRVRAGDYVELFGQNIRVDEAANAAGTISFELLTSLGNRCARRYI